MSGWHYCHSEWDSESFDFQKRDLQPYCALFISTISEDTWKNKNVLLKRKNRILKEVVNALCAVDLAMAQKSDEADGPLWNIPVHIEWLEWPLHFTSLLRSCTTHKPSTWWRWWAWDNLWGWWEGLSPKGLEITRILGCAIWIRASEPS